MIGVCGRFASLCLVATGRFVISDSLICIGHGPQVPPQISPLAVGQSRRLTIRRLFKPQGDVVIQVIAIQTHVHDQWI